MPLRPRAACLQVSRTRVAAGRCNAMKSFLERPGKSWQALLCAVCLLAGSLTLPALGASNVPREAPDLALKTVDGNTVTLDSLKGKVVAVLWISTDCPHCQSTCEELAPIYQKYSGQGLEIMGMAVNPNAPGNIDRFRSEHGVKFPIGVSSRSDWMRFADLSVMARAYVPFMMLVDRKGVIRYEHRGMDGQFWSNMEETFLTEMGTLLAE